MICAENVVRGETFSRAKSVQGHFIQVVLQVLGINYKLGNVLFWLFVCEVFFFFL